MALRQLSLISRHAYGCRRHRRWDAHVRLRNPVRGVRARSQRHRRSLVRVPRRRGAQPARADADGIHPRSDTRASRARARRHDRRPGLGRSRSAASARADACAPPRARPRRTRLLDLHRRLRPRRRRPPRRTTGDDALDVCGSPRGALPADRRGSSRALRRRVRPRRRGRGHGRPPDGDAALSHRRAGAIRGHADRARVHGRDVGAARVGTREPPERALRGRPRAPRRDEPAHADEALPRDGRRSTRRMAAARAHASGQRLLESTDEPIERVARGAGYDSSVTMRAQFATRLRTSPRAYRRTFRSGV